MTLFAEILLAILWLASPSDGAKVPLVRDAHKEYLRKDRATRFKAMEDAAYRDRVAAVGASQRPLRLAWNGDTNAVFTLEVARDGGERSVFSVSNRTEAYVTNLEVGERYLWSVTQEGTGESASATFTTESDTPRLLWAGGVANFRDLGGWRGLGGKRVRQGMVFRSAGLRGSATSRSDAVIGARYRPGDVRVTAAGIETLRNEFGIRTDIELRSQKETSCMASSALGPSVNWLRMPMAGYQYVDNPIWGREPFAEIFRRFQDEKNYPILFHCSGGRDRTGTLALLLNGILGVSDDDLCRDWEVSIFAEEGVRFAPERLLGFLDYLKTYGGETVAEQCERYALSCGVTKDGLDKFRRIMLEDRD